LVAPSQPVSEEALDWVASLDLQVDNWGEVLEEWRAGMATATHPFTKQQVSKRVGRKEGGREGGRQGQAAAGCV
jgi:hypothetical protein